MIEHMNKSAASPLDLVIKRFGKGLLTSSKQARADLLHTIEKYNLERAKNPGLFFLSDIQLHFIGLQTFLHKAAESFANQDKLSAIQHLTEALYETEFDGKDLRLSNPILQITDDLEPVFFPSMPIHETESLKSHLTDKEVLEDIKRNAPNVTEKMILEWCKTIKNLETKRMQILASAALLAIQDPKKSDKNRSATMALLERSWTGFSKSFSYIYNSSILGNLAAAMNEMQRSIARGRSKPIRLTDLPKRLNLRRHDYVIGRGNLEMIDKDKPESIELMIEKYDNEIPPELIDKKSVNVINYVKFKRLVENLSPKKYVVFKKCLCGEKLSTSERKIKSRLSEEFEKEILGY